MKHARMLTLAAAFLLLFTLSVRAEDAPAPVVADASQAPHTAVYKVPNLNDALSQSLVKGLSAISGVISAKPDTAAGCLSVTFEPAKTGTEAILAQVRQTAPEASLDTVGPADPKSAGKDCGKCPMHKTCMGNKG